MRALQLAGMSERTQQCYTRSVRMLADFYNKTPDQINEQELQDHFLHRKNVDKWSAATLRICYSGIKFFFINVLKALLLYIWPQGPGFLNNRLNPTLPGRVNP